MIRPPIAEGCSIHLCSRRYKARCKTFKRARPALFQVNLSSSNRNPYSNLKPSNHKQTSHNEKSLTVIDEAFYLM